MEISTKTTIETLISLGLIKSTQVEEWNKKSIRLQAKIEKENLSHLIQGSIMNFIDGDDQKETRFFSVKKTSNSTGLLDILKADHSNPNLDRATTLKALSALVKKGLITKIGVIGDEIKSPSEVNAFQIRYTRA